MPDWINNVNFLQWLINNGVGVAFAFLLLLGINRSITDAIKYFTGKLDNMVQTQQTTANKLGDHLDKLSESAAGNNQALQSIMIFMAQNMAQIVAHRQSVEGEEVSLKVPGPPINTSGVADTTNDPTPTKTSSPQNNT